VQLWQGKKQVKRDKNESKLWPILIDVADSAEHCDVSNSAKQNNLGCNKDYEAANS
jgi:hypothetical protein